MSTKNSNLKTCIGRYWVVLSLLCLHYGVFAQAPQKAYISWRVQPKVCIVAKLGDSCEMALLISTDGLKPRKYCYFKNNQKMHCKTFNQAEDTVVVKFSQHTVLELRDQNDTILLSHEIQIKARNRKPKTRRVRQPWSLF